ncbi:hypothetical protein CEXT_34201 [Caerostris extrusa]|uniref:Uncharacterized protein n=1 Tax=Caerostris extrusa TaxID=172846 RepID=A0AAV4PMX1_CAEEX|nr:hypothetical protein CEXT_34201 [Caerostris extrusa]
MGDRRLFSATEIFLRRKENLTNLLKAALSLKNGTNTDRCSFPPQLTRSLPLRQTIPKNRVTLPKPVTLLQNCHIHISC